MNIIVETRYGKLKHSTILLRQKNIQCLICHYGI
nr:MAG TPA: hypothetical protein [Caudoviricetes sp.]